VIKGVQGIHENLLDSSSQSGYRNESVGCMVVRNDGDEGGPWNTQEPTGLWLTKRISK
jgi:hypothetical protein